jgi:hypothetical protein
MPFSWLMGCFSSWSKEAMNEFKPRNFCQLLAFKNAISVIAQELWIWAQFRNFWQT